MAEVFVKGRVVRIVCRNEDTILFVSSYDRCTYWEFPGGEIESHETPEAAARRELSEETALNAATLRFIMSYRRSIPYNDNIVWDHYVFEAMGCDYSHLHIDGDEIMKSIWMTRAEALVMPVESMTSYVLESSLLIR